MALKNVERTDSEWSFCLDRLFDPEELYYTPMDELIKRYKKRNLIPGRIFNLAKKYGTVTQIRTRTIHAPQMERAGQRIYGTENFYYPPPKVFYCGLPNENNKVKQTEVESCSSEDENDENVDYNKWMEKRKQLRSGLNQIDLKPEYLKRKKNLTEIERRVLYKMIHVDKEMQTDPVKEKNSNGKKSPKQMTVYPTPLAMKNIEEFLAVNKWRLIDLFKDLDKNKDWNVKKDDFIRECKKGRMDISDSMLDELIIALHNPKTNHLNYRELAKGRSSHLSDRRNELKDNSFHSNRNILYSSNSSKKNDGSPQNEITKSYSSVQSMKSEFKQETRENGSRLSTNLQLPKIDSSMDQYPPVSSDKIKIERSVSVASSRSLVKRSNSELSNKDEISDTKSFIDELRHKNIKEYVECLEKTKSINFKTNSSLLNGLIPPSNQTTEELIKILKEKSDEKKNFIKNAEKEAKLRNRRKKLINQL